MLFSHFFGLKTLWLISDWSTKRYYTNISTNNFNIKDETLTIIIGVFIVYKETYSFLACFSKSQLVNADPWLPVLPGLYF